MLWTLIDLVLHNLLVVTFCKSLKLFRHQFSLCEMWVGILPGAVAMKTSDGACKWEPMLDKWELWVEKMKLLQRLREEFTLVWWGGVCAQCWESKRSYRPTRELWISRDSSLQPEPKPWLWEQRSNWTVAGIENRKPEVKTGETIAGGSGE